LTGVLSIFHDSGFFAYQRERDSVSFQGVHDCGFSGDINLLDGVAACSYAQIRLGLINALKKRFNLLSHIVLAHNQNLNIFRFLRHRKCSPLCSLIVFDKAFVLNNYFLEFGSKTSFQKCFKQDMHKIIDIRRGEVTARRIAEVLEILNDGQWHSIDEIQSKVKLDESQSKKITDFLSEYNFVTIDSDKNKVKLRENVRKFLAQKVTP
jgi:hypothetical protein